MVRTWIAVFVFCCATLIVAEGACAQSGGPLRLLRPIEPRAARFKIFDEKTLFRWSGQEGDEGGPAGYDEPLSADRPDVTEASNTVGRRVLQIETGFTFSRDKSGGDVIESHSFP